MLYARTEEQFQIILETIQRIQEPPLLHYILSGVTPHYRVLPELEVQKHMSQSLINLGTKHSYP